MPTFAVNYWALLGFLAARILVGMVWYAPFSFWKPWAKITGVNEKEMQKQMPKAMASDILGSLVMGYVLLFAIKFLGASGNLSQGLLISFYAWLGMVATVQMGMTLYEARPLKFFFIVSGYQLVTMLLGGAALTLWG